MKTIQQVLRETDHFSIERAYFDSYPITIAEITRHEDMTIKEFKTAVSERFQTFLDTLCSIETTEDPDLRGVLFVYKDIGNDGTAGKSMGLVDLNKLLDADDVSKVECYGCEFIERERALGYRVADTRLTQENLLDLVVSFLYEISFFGFDQEHLEQEIAKLDEALEQALEMERNPSLRKNTEAVSLRELLGLPEREVYPMEEEKKKAVIKAEWDYTLYCRCIELERIRADLVSGRI